MKHTIKSIALVALAAFVLPGLGHAETKKTPAKPAEEAAEAKPKKDTYPLYGEVVSITDSTLTIKGGMDKPDRKYAITKETKFVNKPKGDKEGKPAKASDVKEGAWVGGLLKKADKGNDEVLSINVGVTQKEAKEGATKEEEKKPAKKTK